MMMPEPTHVSSRTTTSVCALIAAPGQAGSSGDEQDHPTTESAGFPATLPVYFGPAGIDAGFVYEKAKLVHYFPDTNEVGPFGPPSSYRFASHLSPSGRPTTADSTKIPTENLDRKCRQARRDSSQRSGGASWRA
jgi:hypothetical protein